MKKLTTTLLIVVFGILGLVQQSQAQDVFYKDYNSMGQIFMGYWENGSIHWLLNSIDFTVSQNRGFVVAKGPEGIIFKVLGISDVFATVAITNQFGSTTEKWPTGSVGYGLVKATFKELKTN
jgi:hypothetical protein